MKHLLLILTLFAVPLTSVAVNAGEKEDREAIRALFHQEQDGWRQGNEEMVRATTWDDFYVIHTPRKNDVPRYMLTRLELSEEYYSGFNSSGINEETGTYLTSTVCHIEIKGDVGLAVTQITYGGHLTPKGILDAGHQAIWIAERRKGVWKMKSVTTGFEGFREYKSAPPTPEKSE